MHPKRSGLTLWLTTLLHAFTHAYGTMLVPLYLMDKAFPSRRDFMLVTTTADIEQAHASGYNLRTIQAYIYKPCTPEPACIPPSA